MSVSWSSSDFGKYFYTDCVWGQIQKTCQQVKKHMFTLHIWWWWWCVVVDDHDTMHCTAPANMGCEFYVFLTTTTRLVVANLGLGDWDESWSPRTEQNRTLQKLQTKHESGNNNFLFALHIATFPLTFSFFFTSYIHCISVSAFSSLFLPSPLIGVSTQQVVL